MRMVADVPNDRHVAGRTATTLRNKLIRAGLHEHDADNLMRGEETDLDYLTMPQFKKAQKLMPELQAYLRSQR